MTVEEQRYLEECRKILDKEQLNIVSMAMDYGLQISDIRQIVQSNKNAPCMKEIFYAFMENLKPDVIEFLCDNDFNQYQMKEIIEGVRGELTFEQIRTYAVSDMSANRMKKMRKQLMEAKKDQKPEDDKAGEYMKGLMKIMEKSIQQFQKSNERFDALSILVKEHVVDEKNREIEDLYENLKYKDAKIEELQGRISERDRKISELETAVKNLPGTEGVKKQSVSDMTQEEKTDPEPIESSPSPDAARSFKRRMFGWLLGGKQLPKDMIEQIMDAELSTEQLEEVRVCIDSGLNEQEIVRVIENKPEPARMRKMREILLLMKQRKAGD